MSGTEPVAEADDLLARLVASLDGDPAYERHGELVTDPWGARQWMRFTDPDGEVRYYAVVIERYRPPDPPR